MYAVGRLQSQSVRTSLRSMPCGRCGCAKGSSPAAMRSVQSAHSASPRSGPTRAAALIICVIAWPEAMRRAHASVDFICAKSFGMVRVPLVPSAWHDMQPFVFTVFSHSGCVFMPPTGNSLFCGILSMEYQ